MLPFCHFDKRRSPSGKMRSAQSVLYWPIVDIARPSNTIEPTKLSPSIPYFCPIAIRESPTHAEMIVRESVRKVRSSRPRAKERKTKRNMRLYVIHHIDLSSDPTIDNQISAEAYIFHASMPPRNTIILPITTTSLFRDLHEVKRPKKLRRVTLTTRNRSFGSPVTE
jgi:hypothetical protein